VPFMLHVGSVQGW